MTSSAWPSRPQVKNPRIRRWSSLDVRKHSRGERALEAGSLVAKPRARWRAPPGALVDGRHSEPGRACSLTRVRTEGPSLPRQIRSPNPVGWDRECQRPNRTTLHAVENAAARSHRPVRCSALLILGGVVVGFAEVGCAPSSASPPGALLPQGGRTPRRRSEHVSVRRAVSSTKVLRPGIERSVGARVVDRLQRLVRRIFPVSPRRAARLTRVTQGSASRRFPS